MYLMADKEFIFVAYKDEALKSIRDNSVIYIKNGKVKTGEDALKKVETELGWSGNSALWLRGDHKKEGDFFLSRINLKNSEYLVYGGKLKAGLSFQYLVRSDEIKDWNKLRSVMSIAEIERWVETQPDRIIKNIKDRL